MRDENMHKDPQMTKLGSLEYQTFSPLVQMNRASSGPYKPPNHLEATPKSLPPMFLAPFTP